MASSNSCQSRQHLPVSAAPTGTLPPASAATSHTFPAYLERFQEARRCRNCRPSVAEHPALPTSARCGHCGQMGDLLPEQTTSSSPPDEVTVELDVAGENAPSAVSFLDQVAFEGNSCLDCSEMTYKKIRHWLDEPAPAGSNGDTPLHCVAKYKNLRLFCYLISLVGEEFGLQKARELLRKMNGREETVLHEAIRLGNMDMAKLLMWVDPELARFPEPGQGTSPLYLSLSLGDEHIARMLYRESGTHLSYSGPDGQNALHAAALHAEGMIQTLLDWNEDLCKEKDHNGSTPLHFVVSAQSESYIRRFCFRFPNFRFQLENHATWRVLNANPSAVHQQDNNGFFPVHIATLMNRKVAIRLLLRRLPGCIGLRDNQRRSLLHLAVKNKISRLVKYACGESVFEPILNARDNDGNTALHLAVEVADLSIFCYLLGNPKVLLDVRNNKGQTPLDLAWSNNKRTDFSYGLNPENVIYRTLIIAGARRGTFWTDRLHKLCTAVPIPKPEDEEKEESNKVTDSTRTLGISSVLIASVTFSATFTVSGAIKAAQHTSDGTTMLYAWYFKAFMIANTLAFICSSVATIGLMYSGTPMVKLPIRQRNFEISLGLTITSLVCWAFAFTLGVYMVMASVSPSTAFFIRAITPFLAISPIIRELLKIATVLRSLLAGRRRISFACLFGLDM